MSATRKSSSVHAGRIFLALLAAGLATASFAGGPLYTYDYENRIPYAWRMASWPNGHVPVYTDLGPLGPLSNAQADGLVTNGISQWSNVPTSSFRGTVAGDFSAIGLGDVSSANITSVIGSWNGGGIHVVYDSDGSILTNFFGVPPTVVLGVTNIDYAAPNSPEILEAWSVLSGPGIDAFDLNGIGFAGVVTHELGHALNLGHSQANGAVLESTILDPSVPEGCSAPWSSTPAPSQIETMYPILHPHQDDTGDYAATVDRIDDRAALSDIYPAAGWPANTASIHGQILDSAGNPVTGVNVIARNVADPFEDCASYISGQVSKGHVGPDGSFVLNGLTPGATYALYADKLEDGAFAAPTLMVLPGPEEFFNGSSESGDELTDDRCAWTPVTATVGPSADVNISFNHVPGAPTLITAPTLSFQTLPTAITPDGGIVVGGEGDLNVPIFRWDVNANTIATIGGTFVGSASISDDGTKIAANVVDTDGINKAAIYQNGAWTPLPPSPGAVACGNSGSGPMVTSAYDISGDGNTVVGLSYGTGGCGTSTIRGFKWTAAGGTVQLPKADSPSRAGRANAVNYNGTVIVGWDDANSGQRRGEQWRNGVVSLIKKNNLSVAEALEVSRDGSAIVGLSNSSATNTNAWVWTPSNGVMNLGAVANQTGALASAVNDDASVIVGRSMDLNTGIATPTIWTPGLHWSDLNQFLSAQGVNTSGITISLGMGMTPDGHTITGFASSRIGYLGWILKTPTSVVCHATQNPTTVQTQIVSFPEGLDAALAQGDTLGPCPCVDLDGDGYTNCAGDCNDGVAAIHPGASESCNGIDDDCDGTVDVSAPSARPSLTLAQVAGNTQLSWSPASAATAYDVFAGDIQELHSLAGDFASLTQAACFSNDLAATTLSAGSNVPVPGGGRWFIVRAVNCGGAGTYDESGSSQQGSRDPGIHASSQACP